MLEFIITAALILLPVLVGLILLHFVVERLPERWITRLQIGAAIGTVALIVCVVLYFVLGRACGPWSAEAAIGDWCDRHLTTTVEALEAYREKHGRYPETLWSIAGDVRQGLPATGEPWPTRIHDGPVYVYEPIDEGRSYLFGVWASYARSGPGEDSPFLAMRCVTVTGPEGAPVSLPEDFAEKVGRPSVRERPAEDDTVRFSTVIGIGGGVGRLDHRRGDRERWAFWCEWPSEPYSGGGWRPWWWTAD